STRTGVRGDRPPTGASGGTTRFVVLVDAGGVPGAPVLAPAAPAGPVARFVVAVARVPGARLVVVVALVRSRPQRPSGPTRTGRHPARPTATTIVLAIPVVLVIPVVVVEPVRVPAGGPPVCAVGVLVGVDRPAATDTPFIGVLGL